jgi:thiosulfate/3-mercaptopyruvate sulfurtransferase
MTRFNRLFFSLVLIIGMVGGGLGTAIAKDKFEAEVDKESAAVKVVREVQRGDYDVVTTDELKKWIDSGKAMVIVDTMPLDASYKKQHVPGAVQFLFPIPDMETWDVKETDGKS